MGVEAQGVSRPAKPASSWSLLARGLHAGDSQVVPSPSTFDLLIRSFLLNSSLPRPASELLTRPPLTGGVAQSDLSFPASPAMTEPMAASRFRFEGDSGVGTEPIASADMLAT